MKLLATKGITVICLWKKILILKKANINASKGAAQNPAKRWKFTTSGCYKTERIISELQGKTTQIQSLDTQPTVGM